MTRIDAGPLGPYTSRHVAVAAQPFTHLFADFADVPTAQLRDAALVTGLLIAAASAAGFTAHVAPVVRALPDSGVSALYALEGCHIAVHTFPERGVLLLDVLAPSAHHDAQRAVDVFVRRIDARAVRTGQQSRG